MQKTLSQYNQLVTYISIQFAQKCKNYRRQGLADKAIIRHHRPRPGDATIPIHHAPILRGLET